MSNFVTFDCCSTPLRPIGASLGHVVGGVSTTITPSFKSLRHTVWSAQSFLHGDCWSFNHWAKPNYCFKQVNQFREHFKQVFETLPVFHWLDKLSCPRLVPSVEPVLVRMLKQTEIFWKHHFSDESTYNSVMERADDVSSEIIFFLRKQRL